MFKSEQDLLEELKEIIHRYDLITWPYCMFVHPSNKELCEKVLKEIGQFDDYIIRETFAMDEDKIVVMSRKDLENYANPVLGFENNPFMDNKSK